MFIEIICKNCTRISKVLPNNISLIRCPNCGMDLYIPDNPEITKSCSNCINQCMDMDMDPYCASVNKPWGKFLYRGHPEECGPEHKLWKKDTRR
jgi:hypothetical protein